MLCALIHEVGYVCCVLKHVSNSTCSTCFYYWLRQIRRIRRCLDTESATTLVHTMTASRVDYCNSVLAGHRKLITDSRPVSHLRHSEFHRLDIPQHVQYNLGLAKSWCIVDCKIRLHSICRIYCMHTVHLTFSAISDLWSANRHQLVVPRSKFDRWAFSVADPMTRNSLPDSLRALRIAFSQYNGTCR